MKSDHVLILDIEGEYGHFRKFNTTTSPLTYSTPPRTAVIGILGAILGIEREVQTGIFNEGQSPLAEIMSQDTMQIAVQVLKPIKKVQMGFNLLNTKSKSSFFNIENRTQIEFQLLRNPSYRIFIKWHNELLFKNLVDNVKSNITHFTVSLGLSQFLATVKFQGFQPLNLISSTNYEPVVSILNMNYFLKDDSIQLDNSRQFRYTTDTQPLYMDCARVVKEFAEILLESNGKAISIKSDQIYSVQEFGNIIFL